MLRIVLGIAIVVGTLMPGVSYADDQQIADYVKSRLQIEQQRGNLRGFNVDMRVDRGTVWFKGYVSNEMQEKTILQVAQQAGHLGVVQVVDDIEVQQPGSQAEQRQTMSAPLQQSVYERMPNEASRPETPAYQAAYQPRASYSAAAAYQETSIPNAMNSMIDARNAISNGTPMPFAQAQGMRAMQVSGPAAGAMGPAQMDMGMGVDMGMGIAPPMPTQGCGAGGGMYDAPNLPGYAWPGYAAYPNYAAVSYPQQYSASAWPYIGPFYPYPQVPLGWRKVTLEWDDGWWMLDFNDK
jgi:hypothetical protein